MCRIPGLAVGGSWSAAGVVLVGQAAGVVLRCARTVACLEVTRLEAAKGDPAICCPGSSRMAATFSM